MKRTARVVAPVFFLALLLPGCRLLDIFRGDKETIPQPSGKPLIEFGSRMVYGSQDLKRRLDVMASAQDNFETMLKSLPFDTVLRFLEDSTEEYKNKLLVREWVLEQGLNKSPEYQALVKEAHATLELDLNLELFKKAHLKEAAERAQNITEDDLRKMYEEQRAIVAKQGDDKAKKFPPFEAVKNQFAEMAKQQEYSKLCSERLAELDKKHSVKVNKEPLREFALTLVPENSGGDTDAKLDGPETDGATLDAGLSESDTSPVTGMDKMANGPEAPAAA